MELSTLLKVLNLLIASTVSLFFVPMIERIQLIEKESGETYTSYITESPVFQEPSEDGEVLNNFLKKGVVKRRILSWVHREALKIILSLKEHLSIRTLATRRCCN
jgi:hypothetical protein